jgi:hypothetical protein
MSNELQNECWRLEGRLEACESLLAASARRVTELEGQLAKAIHLLDQWEGVGREIAALQTPLRQAADALEAEQYAHLPRPRRRPIDD